MKSKFSTRILAFVLMMTLIVPMFVFNTSAEATKVSFKLGNDDTASHVDGNSEKTSYTETVDGYTLNITGGAKMYPSSRDAKGNGCIKFGTSSVVGSCSFTVPDEVTSVVLYVAKYKAKTSKVKVNGTSYTLTKSSDNGEYDEITVDTSSTKTVSFTTVSGGVRAMLNGIDFIVPASGEPSISIAGNNDMLVGDTAALTATLTNIEGDVVWTSSANDIATVDAAGNVTGVAMGKVTITAAIGDVAQTKEITVYPNNADVITIAEAQNIAKFAGENPTPYNYQFVGVVESIDSPYTEQYKNVSVTIVDDTGSLYVYRMNGGETLQVGQKIAVTGKLQTYGNEPQVSQYSEYELVMDDSEEAIVDALNALELKMSLAYKYETAVESVVVPSVVTDSLNREFTGASGTTYAAWSGKTGESGAVYAGQSAGGNSAIQLRSDYNNSGIVTTKSGGKVKSITITWNTTSTAGRVLDVYGSNTAYTQATDLYDTAKAGTKVTSFTYAKGTETQTYEFEADYAFVAIRSNGKALYLDSVSIEWASESGTDETVEKEVYSNSEFAFRFGVDEALASIAGIDENGYGLMVSAGGKTVDFSNTAKSWKQEGGNCFVTVTLGDIINEKSKLGAEFTVSAYVVIDGTKYISATEKTYSVAGMIKEYYETNNIAEVEHLYNYLESINLI